jgi:hypothetical protein
LYCKLFTYCTKNGTLIGFEEDPEQSLYIGITKTDVVPFTIAASVEVVPSITAFPPELVQPSGPVLTS